MVIAGPGAVFFGLIVGAMVDRLLHQRAPARWLSFLIALGGVIVGAAVFAAFREEALFGWYPTGVVFGFAASFATSQLLSGSQQQRFWRTPPAGSARSVGTDVLAKQRRGDREPAVSPPAVSLAGTDAPLERRRGGKKPAASSPNEGNV